MPPPPRRRAPAWFVLLVAAGCAVILRSVSPAGAPPPAGAHVDAPPALAFFGFLIAIAEVAWKAFEVVGRVTLQILSYSVTLLWKFVNLIADGAAELAQWTWIGLRKGWALLRSTYTHVLKPGWLKIWKWVDRAEHWLESTFGPVLKWLRRIRKWVLDFYTHFVRPILDLLDITRHALRVLSSLGVAWARALDARLADLESRIERPFRVLLAKINEVINVVNRIVTADGLFRRLVHIRSIERDIREVSRAFANWRSKPLTDDDYRERLKRASARTEAERIRDASDALRDGGGRYQAVIAEMVLTGGKNLQRR